MPGETRGSHRSGIRRLGSVDAKLTRSVFRDWELRISAAKPLSFLVSPLGLPELLINDLHLQTPVKARSARKGLFPVVTKRSARRSCRPTAGSVNLFGNTGRRARRRLAGVSCARPHSWVGNTGGASARAPIAAGGLIFSASAA